MAGGDRDEHASEPGGDFDAEISDTRPATTARSPALQGRDPADAGAPGGCPLDRDASATPAHFAARRTPRQRLVRQASIAATVLLALVIVTGGVPALRDRLVSLVVPPPAPTITPGSDLFTLLPNPPGVTVALDGHTLAHPPVPGDPHPLRLTPGQHTFAWYSHIYPFVPQSCVVSVPPAPDDTCAFVNSDALIAQNVLAPGNALAMHASLYTLQPTQIAPLQQAIQAALAASATSATVRPGESYHTLSPSGADNSAIATQPLRATLSFSFGSTYGNSDPCILRYPAYLCHFVGQNCTDVCTVPNPPVAATAGAPNAWIAIAEVDAGWTYAAPDGRVIATYPDAGVVLNLVVLRITWDGATWHVTPIFGHIPGLPDADDVACDPARYWLSNSTWGFMLGAPPPNSGVQFISGSAPANGCLAILSRGEGSGLTALFLERFGLLLALNDTARSNSLDNFPLADAAAEAQARALAAQAGISLP